MALEVLLAERGLTLGGALPPSGRACAPSGRSWRRRGRRRRRRASAASCRAASASRRCSPTAPRSSTRLAPRKATGPDLMHVLLGSRGIARHPDGRHHARAAAPGGARHGRVQAAGAAGGAPGGARAPGPGRAAHRSRGLGLARHAVARRRRAAARSSPPRSRSPSAPRARTAASRSARTAAAASTRARTSAPLRSRASTPRWSPRRCSANRCASSAGTPAAPASSTPRASPHRRPPSRRRSWRRSNVASIPTAASSPGRGPLMPSPPDLETSLTYCTYCPSCAATPARCRTRGQRDLVPRDKMATMRLLRRAESATHRRADSIRYTAAPAAAPAPTSACTRSRSGPTLFRGRAEAERDGRGHPALRDLVAALQREIRSRGQARTRRRPSSGARYEAQVAFLPGCDSPELAAKMLGLCDRIGAEYVAVADGKHGCGGYPLYAAGQFDAFRIHAERMQRQLEGFVRVVVNCPACVWAMRTHYPAFGVPLAASSRAHLGVPRGLRRAAAHRAPPRGRVLPGSVLPGPLARGVRRAAPPRRQGGRRRARVLALRDNEAECSGGGGLLPARCRRPPARSPSTGWKRRERPGADGRDRVRDLQATARPRRRRGDGSHRALGRSDAQVGYSRAPWQAPSRRQPALRRRQDRATLAASCARPSRRRRCVRGALHPLGSVTRRR